VIQRVTVWALAAVTLFCAVADTAIIARFRSMLSQDSVAVHGWPLATLATVAAAVMGALIVSRYPGHIVGWLLSIVGSVSSVSLLAETYYLWVIKHGGPGSAGFAQFAGWLSLLFSAPVAFTGFTLMLLLAPDGRLLSPRWRIAMVLAFAGLASWTAGVFLTPPSEVAIDTDATGGRPLASALFLVGLILSLSGIVVSVVSVLLRRRRAHGVVRQQLRWISIWSLTLPIGLASLLILNGAESGSLAWLARMPLMLSYASLPICLAIAVLRYRLYGIDMIVNRAVVLALGTGFAAVGYIALVVGVGALVDARNGGFWPSVLATGTVALAFQPVRRSVIRIADRFAYGERAAPYEALASFSRQLGDSPEPEHLLPVIAQAAVLAVSAQYATVRLHIPGQDDRVATWPATVGPASEITELAVIDSGDRLGSIAIRMPLGRAMRPADHALLSDFAGQIALAFRNARLSTELAAQVELLDRRTEQLALSRARVIEARDAESFRLERAIRRDVTSHLEHLPGRLQMLSENVEQVDPAAALDGMINDSVDALEALRTLTRGIYSTQLARFGLASAIDAHLRRAGAGTFTADDAARERRFGTRIESAAYFCYVSAAQELRLPMAVDLSVRHDQLMITVRAVPSPEPDLLHLQDRLDPLSGDLTWTQAAARSVLTIRLPLDPAVDPAAARVPVEVVTR
jgi:hypothetical protein